jgi:hypothetical protein
MNQVLILDSTTAGLSYAEVLVGSRGRFGEEFIGVNSAKMFVVQSPDGDISAEPRLDIL